MHKNLKSFFVVVVLLILSSGCVSYATRIQSGDKIDHSKGYIYGLFNLTELSRSRVALVVSSVDKKQDFSFQFEEEATPYVIAINPGEYFINKFVFVDRKEKQIHSYFSNPFFSVEAGKAYYIGDYEIDTTTEFYLIVSKKTWHLKKISNNYSSTTEQLESQVPFFKNIPKVNVFGDALPKIPDR